MFYLACLLPSSSQLVKMSVMTVIERGFQSDAISSKANSVRVIDLPMLFYWKIFKVFKNFHLLLKI